MDYSLTSKYSINNTNFINPPSEQLCNFIIDKLGISQSALELGVKRSSLENSPLPIVMWSYGLITISQLQIILLWTKDN
tara:strand:+ start:42 stop:278 length:237 start_codon:yes stop_codon:yes gene_type:complete